MAHGDFVERSIDSEEALDRGILAGKEAVDILAGDAEFFRLKGCVDRPVDDLQSAVIAGASGSLDSRLGSNMKSSGFVNSVRSIARSDAS